MRNHDHLGIRDSEVLPSSQCWQTKLRSAALVDAGASCALRICTFHRDPFRGCPGSLMRQSLPDNRNPWMQSQYAHFNILRSHKCFYKPWLLQVLKDTSKRKSTTTSSQLRDWGFSRTQHGASMPYRLITPMPTTAMDCTPVWVLLVPSPIEKTNKQRSARQRNICLTGSLRNDSLITQLHLHQSRSPGPPAPADGRSIQTSLDLFIIMNQFLILYCESCMVSSSQQCSLYQVV